MNDVFLCLGGNLGNRLELLNGCRMAISEQCGQIVKESKIYETEAWGSTSKRKFLNQVIHVRTKLEAPQLLNKLHSIEKLFGRKRNDKKNSDRPADIDILFFNNKIIKTSNLQVPHPRLHLRKFVLKPLIDLDETISHPKLNKTVKQLYENCKDKLTVTEFSNSRKNAFKYICIEGNIGSGKTTLAKELAKQLKVYFLPEEFEKNNLLPLFYQKPKKFAFPLEYSFLLSRYQHITDSFTGNSKIIVSDYSFYKCLWFAKLNLRSNDFNYFKKHFKALNNVLHKPDLIIYLNTSAKNLKKNIKSRGREYELNLSDKYLNNITKQYLKGLKAIHSTKILIIPVKKYHRGLNATLIKTIKNYLLKSL